MKDEEDEEEEEEEEEEGGQEVSEREGGGRKEKKKRKKKRRERYAKEERRQNIHSAPHDSRAHNVLHTYRVVIHIRSLKRPHNLPNSVIHLGHHRSESEPIRVSVKVRQVELLLPKRYTLQRAVDRLKGEVEEERLPRRAVREGVVLNDANRAITEEPSGV